MSQAVKIHRYTLEEYLAMESESEVRHEFIDGEIFAMAGASRAHALIVANLLAALHRHLLDTPCRAMVSDIKVRVETLNRFYYPDLVVSCSDAEREPDSHVETEPSLIVEVLSSSTAVTDRREKRLAYQTLPSLQEYVLVEQDAMRIDVYRRQADHWLLIHYDGHEVIELASLALQIPVADLYFRVLLPANTAQ